MESNPTFKPKPILKDIFTKRPETSNSTKRTLKLITNLLKICFTPNSDSAVQYSVSIDPLIQSDNISLRRKILKSIRQDLLGYYRPYFPAGMTLFSSSKNSETKRIFQTKVDEVDYKITITKTNNSVDLTKANTTSTENYMIKNFIENNIKSLLNANADLIKFDDRSFYSYAKATRLQGKSMSLPGFNTAAMITCSGLYLRINDKNKFLSGKTAIEKIEDLEYKYKNGSYHSKCKEYFQRVSVITKYGTMRVYQISDITFDKNVDIVQIPVKAADGQIKSMSLFEYYSSQYGITIKDRKQPLLIHKPDKTSLDVSYIIPELVEICGLDHDEEENNMDNKRRMAKGGKLTPNEKINKLNDIKKLFTCEHKKTKKGKDGKTNIAFQSAEELRKDWGMEFKDFLQCNGRVLDYPIINYKTTKSEINGKTGKFRQCDCVNPVTFLRNEWLILTTSDNRNSASEAAKNLIKCSKSLGIQIEEPKIEAINARSKNEFIDKLQTVDLNNGKKFVLFILTPKTRSYYDDIKQFLDTRVGIPNQCMNLAKRNISLSVYSNVLNQMVVKARGELYKIDLNQNLVRNYAMLISIDSSRANGNNTKYVVCSTYNPHFSKFRTDIAYTDENNNKEKVIEDLINSALLNFYKRNKNYPKMIILYRNGGNDRQKLAVYEKELPGIKKSLETIEKNENIKIKLTLCCVNKKSDMKFFGVDGNILYNTKPGTCIDTEIVSPDYYEFYLQPQFINQGTATPVHFHVIYDEIKMPIEVFEDITFKQTAYYWNWNGPIREPAILKFAECANSFTSRVLRNSTVVESLLDTPFYI